MEFKYDVKYGSHGLPYVDPEPGAYLRVDHGDEENGAMQVSIVGNREGLLLLAKHLISLAELQRPPGYHFHLDPHSQSGEELGSPTSTGHDSILVSFTTGEVRTSKPVGDIRT